MNSEAEDYERALERARRLVGSVPAPMSRYDMAGIVLLFGIQGVLFAYVDATILPLFR